MSRITPSSRKQYFPRPSLLVSTAYTSVILLPIHVLTHRLNPSLDTSTISALSPAELDYDFVKFGLHTWPTRSFLFYGILVASVLLHSAEGQALLWRTYLAPQKPPRVTQRKTSKVKWRRIIATTGSIVVLSGVYAIWREPLEVLPSMIERYFASFTTSLFYRI